MQALAFTQASPLYPAIHSLHTEAMVSQASIHPDIYETRDAHLQTQALLGISDASQPHSLGEAVTGFLRAAYNCLPKEQISSQLREYLRIDNGAVDVSLFEAAYDFLLRLTLAFDPQLHREEIARWRSFRELSSAEVPDFSEPVRTAHQVWDIMGRAESLVAREGGSIREVTIRIDPLEHLRRLFYLKEGRFVTHVRLIGPTYHDLPEILHMTAMRAVTHLKITNGLNDPQIVSSKVRIIAEAAAYLPSLHYLNINECLFTDEQMEFIRAAFLAAKLAP